ncbi:MAG: DMT family transporter [Paracoccaceae bacterium]|jgi:drug/metabolite transporter (DMT)-like permease
MRLFLITLLALVAFAANSVLTRSALAVELIGPGAFMAIRLASGAVTLGALVAFRGGLGRMRGHGGVISAAALLLYAAAFSFAYVTLEAGIGALILFGGVQITMFAGALLAGERPHAVRWIGAFLGMAGLGVLFGPGAARPDLVGAIMMAFSALGWGIYTLRGRSVAAPLEATAVNFLFAAPFGVFLWVLFPAGAAVSTSGVLLAIASGSLASGVGYALWYSVLPKLESTLAAIFQLSVPIIALAGGVLFLGEAVTLYFAISAGLIIAGVLVAVRK